MHEYSLKAGDEVKCWTYQEAELLREAFVKDGYICHCKKMSDCCYVIIDRD